MYFQSILLVLASVSLNVPFQRVIGASGLVCPHATCGFCSIFPPGGGGGNPHPFLCRSPLGTRRLFPFYNLEQTAVHIVIDISVPVPIGPSKTCIIGICTVHCTVQGGYWVQYMVYVQSRTYCTHFSGGSAAIEIIAGKRYSMSNLHGFALLMTVQIENAKSSVN
jgi:hypothetical protein